MRVRVRKLPDQASSVNIIFQYLPELDVVTAEAVDKSLLVNLFPADTGMYTPRTSNHLHALASPTGLRIPSSLYGRPYKWAQWLCGLYMLTSPIVAPESGKVIKPHPRPEPTTRRLLDMVCVACVVVVWTWRLTPPLLFPPACGRARVARSVHASCLATRFGGKWRRWLARRRTWPCTRMRWVPCRLHQHLARRRW